MYVSILVKSIVEIIYLNNKVEIERWKEEYAYDENTLMRIDTYLQHHKYAMEITYFQDTNKIPLEQLRNDLPGFIVPQMYYFIDDTGLLDYLEQNLTPIGEKIVHDFSYITSEQICKE